MISPDPAPRTGSTVWHDLRPINSRGAVSRELCGRDQKITAQGGSIETLGSLIESIEVRRSIREGREVSVGVGSFVRTTTAPSMFPWSTRIMCRIEWRGAVDSYVKLLFLNKWPLLPMTFSSRDTGKLHLSKPKKKTLCCVWIKLHVFGVLKCWRRNRHFYGRGEL